MSLVSLTHLWCAWHASSVPSKSEGFTERPVVIRTDLWHLSVLPIHTCRIINTNIVSLHIWGVPEESVVSLEYLWYLCIVFGVPDTSAVPLILPLCPYSYLVSLMCLQKGCGGPAHLWCPSYVSGIRCPCHVCVAPFTSLVYLTGIWCHSNIWAVSYTFVECLTHLWCLDRSLVSLKGHWFPDILVSLTRLWCPSHACAVPDMSVVCLILLHYVLHLWGVFMSVVYVTHMWYVWHVCGISDTSVVSITSAVLWTRICYLWPPKVVLTFYCVPERAVVSFTNMYLSDPV